MSDFQNNKISFNIFSWILMTIFILSILLIQIQLLDLTDSVYLIIGFNILILTIAVLYFIKIGIASIFLILAILPLSVVDYNFGRSLQYIVLQNIPITIFIFLALFQFIKEYKPSNLRLEKLFVLMIIYTLYSVFLSVRGIINGAPLNFVFNEFYQNFYYFLPLPIYYLIRNRFSYKVFLATTIFVFVIISIEFFIISYTRGTRFLSFQYLFFPFIIAVLFSLIFLYKNGLFAKTLYVILFILMWIGSIATAARTMWVANLAAIFLIIFFYQKFIKKNVKIFFLISVLFLSLTMPFLIKSDNAKVSSLPTSTKERVESISNPTGDTSFLMRVEASYLAIQKFFQHPIIGEGYGRHIKFKWLLSTEVIYLDNSFLYYLWKGGLIGVFIILSLYIVFIKDTVFVIKNSTDRNMKIIGIIILGSFLAFLMEGLFSANLIGFKLNYLYAIIFAYIIFEKRKIISVSDL